MNCVVTLKVYYRLHLINQQKYEIIRNDWKKMEYKDKKTSPRLLPRACFAKVFTPLIN